MTSPINPHAVFWPNKIFCDEDEKELVIDESESEEEMEIDSNPIENSPALPLQLTSPFEIVLRLHQIVSEAKDKKHLNELFTKYYDGERREIPIRLNNIDWKTVKYLENNLEKFDVAYALKGFSSESNLMCYIEKKT